MQFTKIAESATGSENLIPATVANGLLVNVSQVLGTVAVVNATPGNLQVDASGATVPVANASGGSLAVIAADTAPVAVRLSTGAAFVDTIPVSIAATVGISGNVGITGTPSVAQSGTWNIGTLATITNSVTVTGTVALSGTSPVSGTVTANQGTPNTNANAWPHLVSDGTHAAGLTLVGSAYGLDVAVLSMPAGAALSQQDKTSFTEGTTFFNVIGGVYNDSPAGNPAANQASIARITPLRALHVNLRNQAGTEIGTSTNAVRIDPLGTTAQPVTQSGTWTVTQAAGQWITNQAYINGSALVAAATGIQKVGISDGGGNNFSKTNALAVDQTEQGYTRVSNANTFSESQTDIAIWTPASGKKFVVLGVIVTTQTGGVLKIYDGTNAAANMLFQGTPVAGTFVVQFEKPWASSAANNVLKYSTGSGAAGDLVTFGYEV